MTSVRRTGEAHRAWVRDLADRALRVEEATGNKKDAETLYLEAIKIGQTETEIVDAYVSLVTLLSDTARRPYILVTL